MRKIVSYIVLGLALFGFVYVWISTGSVTTAIIIIGVGLAWFLFENIFEIIALFRPKTGDKQNEDGYKKAKEDLKKITHNNPTLR
ncbi:MAG: hypothetical protein AAFX87_22365 [Bacteroidota bacterium]